MKDLLKFQPPKTARLNAAEYTNFIERFLSLTTACTTCRRRPPLRACCSTCPRATAPRTLPLWGLTESVAELADSNSRNKALATQRTTSVSDAKDARQQVVPRGTGYPVCLHLGRGLRPQCGEPHYRTGPLYPRRERYKHFYQRLSPTQFNMLHALLSYSSWSCFAAEFLYASDCGAKVIPQLI